MVADIDQTIRVYTLSQPWQDVYNAWESSFLYRLGDTINFLSFRTPPSTIVRCFNRASQRQQHILCGHLAFNLVFTVYSGWGSIDDIELLWSVLDPLADTVIGEIGWHGRASDVPRGAVNNTAYHLMANYRLIGHFRDSMRALSAKARLRQRCVSFAVDPNLRIPHVSQAALQDIARWTKASTSHPTLDHWSPAKTRTIMTSEPLDSSPIEQMPFDQRQNLMSSLLVQIRDSATGLLIGNLPHLLLTTMSGPKHTKLQGQPLSTTLGLPLQRLSRLAVSDVIFWLQDACTRDPIPPIGLVDDTIEALRTLQRLGISPGTAKVDASMRTWLVNHSWDEVHSVWRVALHDDRQPINSISDGSLPPVRGADGELRIEKEHRLPAYLLHKRGRFDGFGPQ